MALLPPGKGNSPSARACSTPGCPGAVSAARVSGCQGPKRTAGCLRRLRDAFAVALAPDRDDRAPGAAVVAVLSEVDALPGAEQRPPIAHRDGERLTEQGGLDVRGHVVTAFGDVLEVGRVLGHHVVA